MLDTAVSLTEARNLMREAIAAICSHSNSESGGRNFCYYCECWTEGPHGSTQEYQVEHDSMCLVLRLKEWIEKG